MGKQNHIIRKLIIEVGVPTKEEAFSIQNRISEEFKRIIFSLIEEILDRMSGQEEIIRIEKLEIDVGELSAARLEEELSPKVQKEIEEALVKIIYEIRNSPEKSSNILMTTSGGASFTVQASRETKHFDDLEKLIHFLEFGTLPWSGDIAERSSLREMTARVMEAQPEQLRIALSNVRNQPHVFKRLVLQLPEDQLYYLAAILGCDFSSELKVFAKRILEMIEIISQHKTNRNSTSIDPQVMQRWIMEEMLRFFSSGIKSVDLPSGSAGIQERKITFIAHTVNVISQKAGITISPVIPAKLKELPVIFKSALKLISKKADLPARKKSMSSSPETPSPKAVAIEKLPETPEADEGIYISNGGIVIIAPYLPAFFTNLGLVKNKKFCDEDSIFRAIHILHWLVYGDSDEEISEHDLVLNKILCGIEIAEPAPQKFKLKKKDKKECIALLESVIANWPIIRNTSTDGLRSTFFRKEGKLTRDGSDWSLFIHRDSAVDMLIDRLPWSISMLKFPWNEYVVYTQW